MKNDEGVYGLGPSSRAWQPIIGCDPHMSCAPRCWARRTIARVVECQRNVPAAMNSGRADFYQVALTPDGQRWSGQVILDDSHLNDPLRWRKSALIATGFHGDIGRLADRNLDRVFGVMGMCQSHRFIVLTKQPEQLLRWAKSINGDWRSNTGQRCLARAEEIAGKRLQSFLFPMSNVTIGCSVMNQAEADRQRPAMAALAKLGWHTHCWYEPAIGPVDWTGWEFLELLICGGESGKGSRPMHPMWSRNAYNWARRSGVFFKFKQQGDWIQSDKVAGAMVWSGAWGVNMVRVGKKDAGHLLDGREYNELPAWMVPHAE